MNAITEQIHHLLRRSQSIEWGDRVSQTTRVLPSPEPDLLHGRAKHSTA
jgi:hypothetical protein